MILFDKFIDLGEEICENNSFIQNQMTPGVAFPEKEDVVDLNGKTKCYIVLMVSKFVMYRKELGHYA